MSYSEFTIDDIKNKLNLKIQERVELFYAIESITPSSLLRETLK